MKFHFWTLQRMPFIVFFNIKKRKPPFSPARAVVKHEQFVLQISQNGNSSLSILTLLSNLRGGEYALKSLQS